MDPRWLFIFISLVLCSVHSKVLAENETDSGSSFGFMKRGSSLERNQGAHSHRRNMIDKKITDLIPHNYNIHEPPPLINGEAVPVKFSMSIKNIPEINELKQMMSIEMNLRVYWQDMRLIPGAEVIFEKKKHQLTHNYISLNPVILSKIWVPDIYTDYAKGVTSQKILSPPVSLRIYPNGTVRYSARVTIEMSCPMDFRTYPGDTQRCDLRLESYGYTRKELDFSWRYEGRTVNIGHRLPHFDFDVSLIGEKGDVNFESGSYPAIYVCLRLHRRMSYHVLQTYIPSSIFVITSWVSYLVPIEYAPGRLAIGMTLLLTLTAMFGAIRQLTPSVSYIKALDIWMVACILFVFLSLVEFAFVLRMDKLRKLSNIGRKSQFENAELEPLDDKGRNWIGKDDYDNGVNVKKKSASTRRASIINFKEEQLSKMRRRLETISAIMSPALFIIFNLIYWPWLLFTAPASNDCL